MLSFLFIAFSSTTTLAAGSEVATSDATWTQRPCDFYVSLEGNDAEEGAEIEYPKKTLTCALDPNCNNGLEAESVICMLAGEYEVYDRVRPGCKFEVTVRAIGEVILTAVGQTSIVGVGRTPMNFEGIHFTGGRGTTGAGIYGEAKMRFKNCIWTDNESTVDGAAVMVMRTAEFEGCHFYDNKAKYAGAVRISDIGSASFKDCVFSRNRAHKKGGAIVTQIENKNKNKVTIEDTLFCFNDSPEGKHIFNFRTSTHECTGCQFNTKACCNDHGKVIADKTVEEGSDAPSQICLCDAGWSGATCTEGGAAIDGKEEL